MPEGLGGSLLLERAWWLFVAGRAWGQFVARRASWLLVGGWVWWQFGMVVVCCCWKGLVVVCGQEGLVAVCCWEGLVAVCCWLCLVAVWLGGSWLPDGLGGSWWLEGLEGSWLLLQTPSSNHTVFSNVTFCFSVASTTTPTISFIHHPVQTFRKVACMTGFFLRTYASHSRNVLQVLALACASKPYCGLD